MSLFTTLKGIATELLDLPAKADYVKPKITGTRTAITKNISGRKDNCQAYPVIEVTAGSYADAAKFAEGTYPGNVSKSIVHVGRNKWEIRVEEWDTEVRR